MDKHFTVTIHDDSGYKQFNLHKFVKKAIIYTIIFIFTMIFGSVATILYLNYNVKELEKKKEYIQHAYMDLKAQNSLLQKDMQSTKATLYQKKSELDELSNSLSEIEMMIGLKPVEKESLRERVSIAQLSSEERATLLQLIPNGSPIEYKGITSKFGYRTHPTLHRREFHNGTDLKAKMKTPVYATADGIINWAGYHKRSGYGRLIIIEHIYGFRTYFGHLNRVVVKSGQFVQKGDLIAYTGNSGISNGPHLHYEIRFNQRALNPYYFIKWTQQHYNEIFQKEKKVPWQSLITAMSRIRIVPQMTKQPLLQQDQKLKEK